MERLAHRWAATIGAARQADEEEIAVMAYGLIAILQTGTILVLALALGFLIRCPVEVLIAFFIVGLLRREIGGAHSDNFYHCLFFSVFCIVLFSAACRYGLAAWLPFWGNIAFCGGGLLTAVVLIARLAPVDSPNKPIRSPEKIRRLRRQAAFTLLLIGVLAGVLLGFGKGRSTLVSFADCLILATLWQAFMLTRAGHQFIQAVDRSMQQLTPIKRKQ